MRSREVQTLNIDPALPGYDSLRLFPAQGSLPTQPATYSTYGPEPEYIAVDKTGKYAHGVLQEANGIAVLNLADAGLREGLQPRTEGLQPARQ